MKIYMDWNAMSLLKPQNIETNIEFANKINSISDLCLPYSPAHLYDLLKSWNTSKENNKKISDDLKFISKRTQNIMHIFYFTENKIKIVRQNPKLYFNSIKDDYKQSLRESLKNGLFKDSEIKQKVQPFIKKINDLFEKANFHELFDDLDLPPEQEFLRALLPKRDQTFMQYIDNILAFLNDVRIDHSTYKQLRTVMHTGLKLDPKLVSNWTNPYQMLDAKIPKSIMRKSLGEFLNEINPKSGGLVNDYEVFMAAYIQLDMFAYRPDKLTPKNTFENITNDSQHAFFATQCDYFITCDDKTESKSIAAYNYFGVKTKVLTPKKFIESDLC